MPERKIDHVVEARRQKYIEILYERSGRSNGLYSGLYEEHINNLIEQDMREKFGDD